MVDVDAEMPSCALNLRVAEQKLEGPKIAGPLVDHRCFGTPQ
jgi:hypothetical protein